MVRLIRRRPILALWLAVVVLAALIDGTIILTLSRGLILFCIWSADRSVILYRDATSYLIAEENVREIYPMADFL